MPLIPPSIKTALTVASSDSGGGAGIQADLKTFAALKVFGMSAISAVTAQNSVEVSLVETLSPKMLVAQLKAVHKDIPVHAVKIGLLGSVENSAALAAFLTEVMTEPPVVLDPVMVSTSGHCFLSGREIEALKDLFRRADLVTPNRHEAEILSGLSIETEDGALRAAETILKLGARGVLIKGGHADGGADDFYLGPEGAHWFRAERIDTKNSHGTGCTLSSAIAAGLAKGFSMKKAVGEAKDYVNGGLRHALQLGAGPGPLHHFHQFYDF